MDELATKGLDWFLTQGVLGIGLVLSLIALIYKEREVVGIRRDLMALHEKRASELATMNEKLGELTTRSCNMLEPLVVLMGRLERMMD